MGFTMPSSSCSRWGTARHATWHPSRHATLSTCSLVHLHHDGVYNAFQLLLLGLELVFLSKLVFVEPVKRLLNSLLDLVLVIPFKLVFELLLLKGVAHCEAVVLESVLGFNLLLVGFVLCLELLCLSHHVCGF